MSSLVDLFCQTSLNPQKLKLSGYMPMMYFKLIRPFTCEPECTWRDEELGTKVYKNAPKLRLRRYEIMTL